MTGSKLLNIVGAIVVVGGITALVLPGRQTPQVVTAIADGFSNSLSTAITGGRYR